MNLQGITFPGLEREYTVPQTAEDVGAVAKTGDTMTDSLKFNGSWKGVEFGENAAILNAGTRLTFDQRPQNSTGRYERYTLPTPTERTEDVWYAILTTKIIPAMQLGVEYSTPEKWQNKTVYTKLVDCGTIPGKARTVVAHNLNSRIIRYAGSLSTKGSLPYRDPSGAVTSGVGNGFMDIAVSGNNIIIVSNMTDGSSQGTAAVQLWYVKD